MTLLNKTNKMVTYIKSKKILKEFNQIAKDFIHGLEAEAASDWDKAAEFYKICMDYDSENPLFALKLSTIFNHQKKVKEAKDLAIQTINSSLYVSYDAISAINIHSPLFLERHLIAEFIIKNKEIIEDRISLSINNSHTGNQRSLKTKVFVFWDHPEKMPEIVKAARSSLREYINGTYELIELDDSNIEKYLDIPPNIKDEMTKIPAHFSDWLRTKLLKKYGGLWLDSTCLLSKNLETSLDQIIKEDNFFYAYNGSRVGSWFFYAKQDSYILHAIDTVLNLWWEKEGYLTNYFMYHDIVEMLYWTDNLYKKHWDAMKKTHPKLALELNRNLTLPFKSDNYIKIIESSFIHKLTYKVPKSCYQHNSYMNHIINEYKEYDKELEETVNKLAQQLPYCTRTWIYQKKLTVLEFEYDSKKFAYDIYKNNNTYHIDLVVRNNDFKKLFTDINNEKISSFYTEKKLDIDKISIMHKEVIDKIDHNYAYNVSIIVTTFNREKTIEKLLNSLRDQDKKNITYEVIIIDDASNDNTETLLKNYIKKHKLNNFKYYLKPYNSGNPSIPRNDGIFLAKGKYVFFVDSDDYIEKDTIYSAYNLANKNNSDITFIRIGSLTGNRKGFGEKLYSKGTVDKANFLHNSLYHCPQIFCFFNRNFLIKNRILFNPIHKKWEDLIFISKSLSTTDKYSILANKVYYYLEDFQEDNLTLTDLNIYQQVSIMLECHNFYLFSLNTEKYSGFLNRLITFLLHKLKSNLLSVEEKFFVFSSISNNLNFELIEFSYLENAQNKKVVQALIAKNFNSLLG